MWPIINALQHFEQQIELETGLTQFLLFRNADQPFLLFFSLAHVHTPLFKTPAFAGKSRLGRYGDNMEEVDWMIGESGVESKYVNRCINLHCFFSSVT